MVRVASLVGHQLLKLLMHTHQDLEVGGGRREEGGGGRREEGGGGRGEEGGGVGQSAQGEAEH